VKRWQFILVFLIVVGVNVHAQEAPAVPGVYRVQVVVRQGDDGPAVAKGLAATYGGRLESAMAADHTVVMTVDDAVLTLLERDPRVVSVERDVDESAAAIQQPPTPESSVPQRRTGTLRLETNSTAAPLTAGPYKYDASGNIIEIGAERFVYDVYSRVKSGTVARGTAAEVTQEYWYDRYGNLTSVKTGTTTIPLTVDQDTNRLTHHNGSVVSYDASGQVVQAGTSSFTYDGSGMMTSSGTSGVPSNIYIYTPSDERIASVLVSGNAEVSSSWSFRDASGRVLRRLDRQSQSGEWNWTWRQDYIYNGNEMLASENDSAPKTRHYSTDHLGSPRLITDNGGMLVGQHTYFPFGSEASAVAQGLNDTKRFTGHERDASGLDYMHARYYNWAWGRFLSADPGKDWDMAQPQAWNLFTYVRNNPVGKTDPTGRRTHSKGISANVAFGAYLGVSYNVNTDDKGNVSLTFSVTTGGGTPGGGVQGTEGWSTNNTVHDIPGTNGVVGKGAGDGIEGGVELEIEDGKVETVTFGAGVGIKSIPGSPIEAHGGVQRTWEMASINIPDTVESVKATVKADAKAAFDYLFGDLLQETADAADGNPPEDLDFFGRRRGDPAR
jgi:RHS repeat-associated protein